MEEIILSCRHGIKPTFFIFMIAFLPPLVTLGQDEFEIHSSDTTSVRSLQQFIAKSHVHGQVRNYFMSTWNYQELSDHYTNAISGRVGFRTANFRNFRFGISASSTYNLISSNLNKVDPVALKRSVTELELYDLLNPSNKHSLYRLESMYLVYNSKHLRAKAGRFTFNSPLINPQDSRMRPYAVQGGVVEVPLKRKNGRFLLAWLDGFSPRSVLSWHQTSHSIGLYSLGVNLDGKPATYRFQLQTRGVAIAGLEVESASKKKWQVWNYHTDNISNSSYTRLMVPVKDGVRFGVEGLYQVQVGNGGHNNPDSTYFPDQQVWLAGLMASYDKESWHLSLNYLHISNQGRFTFPREWGREQFFATLPRGRLEGLGNTNLLVAKGKKEWVDNFLSELSIARAWLPSLTNYSYNKYGSKSYWSSTIDLNYKFVHSSFKGLTCRLLYVVKVSPGGNMPVASMFYNTNYHQLNFVTQVSF